MITVEQIKNLLSVTKGAVFATVEMVTDVPLSAGNKKAGIVIKKYTTSNVILFNNLKDADPYMNKVNKTKDSDGDFGQSEPFPRCAARRDRRRAAAARVGAAGQGAVGRR